MKKTLTIPSDSNYVVGSGLGAHSNYNTTTRTFDVQDITISQVRTILGETSYDLSVLCNSSNINVGSLFKPNGLSPYRLGDFAGYNHAAHPSTYYLSKETERSANWEGPVAGLYSAYVAVLLSRGELAPTGYKSWSYIKARVYVPTLGQTFSSALTAVPTNYDPVLVYVKASTNDIVTYTDCTLYVDYCDNVGNTIETIEDTHPNFTFNVSVTYTYLDMLTSNMSSISSIRHYYVYPGIETYIEATNTQVYLDDRNTSHYSLYTQAFVDSIPATIDYEGSTVPYAYTTYVYEGTKTVTFEFSSPLSVDDTFKFNDVWYKVRSIQSGYIACRTTYL